MYIYKYICVCVCVCVTFRSLVKQTTTQSDKDAVIIKSYEG